MQHTLRTLKETIDNILTKHPEWENLPLMYASDDEGNNYQIVYNSLCPAQVHDIKQEEDLELVGFQGEENIADEDVNCICIN